MDYDHHAYGAYHAGLKTVTASSALRVDGDLHDDDDGVNEETSRFVGAFSFPSVGFADAQFCPCRHQHGEQDG